MATHNSRETTAPSTARDLATPAGDGALDGLAASTAPHLLGLEVRYPAPGVCVVVVEGEVDMLTAPLLEACVREQLAALPKHLVLDLESVRFLGSSGLSCLLRARELTQQSTGVELHLAGLVTRAVAHPLEAVGLLEYFEAYRCLTDALTSLTDSRGAVIRTEQVELLSVDGSLDDAGLTQLRRRLQARFDAGTQRLVVNLAGVTSCDRGVFSVLARTHQILTDREGWMRLVGVGDPVRNALDAATPAEYLLVHQALDWTGDLTG